MNLAVENEFDVTEAKNARRKKLRADNVKRTKPLMRDYDSARLSPDSRYLSTAGTVPICNRGGTFHQRKATVDETNRAEGRG